MNQAPDLKPLLGEIQSDRTANQPHPHHANAMDRPWLRRLTLIHRIDLTDLPMLIDRSL